MQAVVVLLVFVFLFLAIKKIDWAVLLLIACLPLYVVRFKLLVIPSTLLEVMVWILFAVWFFKHSGLVAIDKAKPWRIPSVIKNFYQKIFKDRNKVRYPFDWEIVALLAVSLIAVFAAGATDKAFGIWKAYFFDAALFYLVFVNIFTPKPDRENEGLEKNIERVVLALGISAFLVSIFAIYQKFTGAFIPNDFWRAEANRRVTSVFEYPNAVGLYLSPIILILIGWTMGKKRQFKITNHKSQITNKFKIQKTQIFIFITIFLSLLAVYFAKSEGALIGIAAGIFSFCLLANKFTRWLAAGIVIVFCCLLAFNVQAREYVVEKAALKDLSGEIRKQIWRESWQMLRNGKLVTGTGLNNYQEAVRPYHQEGIFFNKDKDPDFRRKIVIFDKNYKMKYWQPTETYLYPHNIILNFWSELGILGMILFIWIISKFFYLGIRNWESGIGNQELGTATARDSFENKKLIAAPNSKFQIPNYHVRYFILGLMSSMVTIIIHGLVDVPYFKNDLALLFWLIIGLAAIFELERKLAVHG